MQSDFADRCKHARARIPIPVLPLGTIERGAVSPLPRYRRTFAAALVAAASLAAVAVSAQVLGGTRFSFAPGGGVSMQLDQRAVTLAPTNANLQAAIKQTGFHVIVPAGLPPGSALHDLGRIGRSVLMLGYSVPDGASRRKDVEFWLVNRADVGAVEKAARNPSAFRVDVRIARRSHWSAGAEEVIVVARGPLSAAQLKRVEEAMLAAVR
jgi:hypothetical protein